MNESKASMFFSISALFSNNFNDHVWECFVNGYRKSAIVTYTAIKSKKRFQIFLILNSLSNVLETEICNV